MKPGLLSSAATGILRRLWRREMPCWPTGELTEEGFLQELEAQGMSALLWYQLNQQEAAPPWPAAVLQTLHERARREVAVEMLWERETQAVLDAMAENGIRPLLFKGAALSHALYPQVGLRPRCDADLLVPESRKDAAQLVMKSLGYTPLYEAKVEYISGQMTWVKPAHGGGSFSHDLHWRIRNNQRRFARTFCHAYLDARAEPLPQMGDHARTLNPADALLLACMHRAGHLSHSGDRLIWLHDIHLLVEALHEKGVECFCRTVRKLELESLCAEAFAVTAFWFDTRFPPALDLMREDAELQGMEQDAPRPDRAAGIRNTVRRELREMTWLEGLEYLVQNVFPPPGYMKWRYARNSNLALPWLYLKRLVQGLNIFIGR
jgi:hypothetical protein